MPKTLASGAIRLPTQHISVRVPWNDVGWAGYVCKKPRANSACLVLPRIAESRKDDEEDECAGSCWKDLDKLPPCAAERGSFMAEFGHTRTVQHPYAVNGNKQYQHFRPTVYQHDPYSAACVPFRWMSKKNVLGDDGAPGLLDKFGFEFHDQYEPQLDFDSEWIQDRRNQLASLDTFFSAIEPEQSLCFFYAKKTPLSEQSGRVLIGVAKVSSLGPSVEYEYEDVGSNIRCVLWERNVRHTLRPDFTNGFLLPYQELVAAAEKDPELDLETLVAFAPDEYWGAYSYGSEHVAHDGAIASLMALLDVLPRIGAVVPGPWAEAQAWIDHELNRLWEMRGPFPGMGSALVALGLSGANLVAWDIASALADADAEFDEDPWELFDQALDDPSLLTPAAGKHLGPTIKEVWHALPDNRRALLKLLSRFSISEDQLRRFYDPATRACAGIEATDEELLDNPYLVFELDRAAPDPIHLSLVDRGIFPDPVVAEKYPLPERSHVPEPIDPRRVRAFVIENLETRASEGHTVVPRPWVSGRVQERDVRPKCAAVEDVLEVAEKHFAPLIEVVELSNGDKAYQIDRLARTRDVIAKAATKRSGPKAKRHSGSHDWRALIDNVLPESTKTEFEERARTEKARGLQELYESRICVLVGPAGTGKTKMLEALCNLPEIENSGVLLLAPTGKARVRMQQATGRSGAFTIAQFLHRFKRYDGRTGAYLVTGSQDRESAYKTVVIDECSMLTEEQLAATLDALKGVQRLILVGDPRQLPPIGSGRPFLDIVRKLAPDSAEQSFPRVGPCYVELTVRRRQTDENQDRDDLLLADWFSGRPQDAGADEIWDRLSAGEASGHIELIEWSSAEELEEKLLAKVVEVLGLSGPDDQIGFEEALGGKAWQSKKNDQTMVFFNTGRVQDKTGPGLRAELWQILSPVRAQQHGVDALNRLIQQRFRADWLRRAKAKWPKVPSPKGPDALIYGDKIINVRNQMRKNYYPKDADCFEYVANGEVGVVVGVARYGARKNAPRNLLEVEFSTQPFVAYKFWGGEFGEDGHPLELAYALTVHKTQGSEFGTTFVVIPDPCRLLSRELLYTALTRQRDKVILFHQGSVRGLRQYAEPHRSETAKRLTNLFHAPDPVEMRDSFLESHLIHRTRRGEAVRSKSEVIIADLLLSIGIDQYDYEAVLRGSDGQIKYPDFTIEDDSGAMIYIEHLGMLSDPAYRRRWERKLAWYRAQDILPDDEGGGENGTLVITRDEDNGGIDSRAIEARLRKVLDL